MRPGSSIEVRLEEGDRRPFVPLLLEGDEDKLHYLFPAEEILARCEVLKSLGAEGDDMYSSYWKEFKAE